MATFPLHFRHIFEHALSDKIQRKLAVEVYDQPDEQPTTSRPAGDPHALRGIPVVGAKGGLGGAIIGSKP